VINERPAADSGAEWPAERELGQAWHVLFRRDLPDLFESDSEFRNVAVFCQVEPLQKNFGEAPACSLGEQRVFRTQFHTASKTVLMRAVFGNPHVAGRDARDRPTLIEQNFRRSKARINLHTERLGLGRKIFANEAKRPNKTAVIAHQRWRKYQRKTNRAPFGEPVKTVVGYFGLERFLGIGTPFRQQAVKRRRIEHDAGQNVRADFGALLHHDDRNIGADLFEADGGSQPRGPGADDHHVKFHRLSCRQLSHEFLPGHSLLLHMGRQSRDLHANVHKWAAVTKVRRAICLISISRQVPTRLLARSRSIDLRPGTWSCPHAPRIRPQRGPNLRQVRPHPSHLPPPMKRPWPRATSQSGRQRSMNCAPGLTGSRAAPSKRPRPSWSSRTAIRKHGGCLSAKRRGPTKSLRVCLPSAGQASCASGCWRRSASIAHRFTS